MLRSRKSTFIFKLYSWYLSNIINKDFAGYTFNIPEVKNSEAILLLANHFSWWDGLLMFHINKRVFKKQFHVLVSEADYNKHSFLKYMGAFAPEGKAKSTLDTLLYAGQLLDDPANLVLIFPQGKIYSSHVSSVSFEKGIMQVFNASKKKFQVVFSVTLMDHSKRKPVLRTDLLRWDAEEYISLQLLKSEYNKHYQKTLRNQNTSL
ncbi:MAG: glycerol acyltransferase [Flavobacterium sp.]|nr:MAG: glycerol acyltransferase [Flavobacterium sp.]